MYYIYCRVNSEIFQLIINLKNYNMALIYKSFQSSLKTKSGKKLYYPTLVKYKKVVDTQKLAEIIATKASLTPGDVHNVVRNLMEVMKEQLLNSKTVRLDGLGTFTMKAHAGGNGVETANKVSPAQIKYLKCQFTPEYKRADGTTTTRALTTGVEYVHVNELMPSGDMASNGNSNGNSDVIDPTV